MDKRREHLTRFYSLLDRLEKNIGGARTLAACSGLMDWPVRGVYFFREPGEIRTDTGDGPRIVRVGTHALHIGSGRRLWDRLREHKGFANSGSGNHRASVFRDLVGAALIRRDGLDFPTWGKGNSAKAEIRSGERDMECRVSQYIGIMPFLWLSVGDGNGPGSRGYIERHTIALLSNYTTPPLDPPSPEWLGWYCNRERVRGSGLWNSNHIDKAYDPAFLDEFDRLVAATGDAS